MKLKLDENIDIRVVSLLRLAGHDVATVPGQNLSSAPDELVIRPLAKVTFARGGKGKRLKGKGFL